MVFCRPFAMTGKIVTTLWLWFRGSLGCCGKERVLELLVTMPGALTGSLLKQAPANKIKPRVARLVLGFPRCWYSKVVPMVVCLSLVNGGQRKWGTIVDIVPDSQGGRPKPWNSARHPFTYRSLPAEIHPLAAKFQETLNFVAVLWRFPPTPKHSPNTPPFAPSTPTKPTKRDRENPQKPTTTFTLSNSR